MALSTTQTSDPIAHLGLVLAEAGRRVGLMPREISVIKWCVWARSQVENGYFLASPGLVPASERLIARGYLTRALQQCEPYDPKGFGMTVLIEQTNLDRLIGDANAALAIKRAGVAPQSNR